MDRQEECRHGMNPEWCAECKGLKTAEEEAEQEDQDFKANIKRWSSKEWLI